MQNKNVLSFKHYEMFILICKPIKKKQLSKWFWDIFDMFLLSPARFLSIHNHTS